MARIKMHIEMGCQQRLRLILKFQKVLLFARLIHFLGEICALNGKIGGSKEQAKFGFPVAAVTACRANFEKSYLTQF